MAGSELELLRDGVVVRVIPVEASPVQLGRDLTNTVVLLDDEVSAIHAVVGAAPGGLEIRDLRSTNGTFVNGTRVDGARALRDRDEIALGTSVRLRVRMPIDAGRSTLTIEDLTAGTAHVIDDQRFRIGSGRACHVRLPDGPECAAILIVHAGGDVWLGADGGDRPLEPGEPFEVAGHRFRIAAVRGRASSTVWGCKEARYGYELQVGVGGAGGPHARLVDPVSGRSHQVTAENRATLLYALACRLLDDRAAGRPEPEVGWQHDDELIIAIWGRSGLRQAGSNFSVLLHRVRREIEDGGFDPWFIEKRRGATRLRLSVVTLDAT